MADEDTHVAIAAARDTSDNGRWPHTPNPRPQHWFCG